MKNSIALLVLIFSLSLQAQRKPKIKGSRNVIEVREDLPAFNTIQLDDNLTVILQGASSTGYTLMADDNLVKVLKFEVIDSVLTVSSSYRITAKKRLDITINYAVLEAITISDGKVEIKDIITSDILHIDASGSSKLELAANAGTVDVRMRGNSDGDFKIDADSLVMDLKDKANLTIYASGKTNNMMLQDNVLLNLEGTVDSLSVHLSENTNLKGAKYEAVSIVAKLEASSKARINALKNIDLYASGSSKTYLYGNPIITISEFLDTSQLHKEKN